MLPDVIIVARTWLLADTAVTDLVDSRIMTRSAVDPDPTYPYVTLQRIGGIPNDRRVLDAARVEVNVWSADVEEAHEVARTVRGSLIEMGEGYTHAAGQVTQVEDRVGITWSPDDVRDPVVPRFVFAVTVFLG